MQKPVIGVTAYVEPAHWGAWEAVPAVLLPEAYVARIAAAGGIPVVIPPVSGASSDLLDRLDGLLFAGGADLSPELYGAEQNPATTGVRPDRDAAESALLAAALARDLPVLGVCRGMQLLVAHAGGSLHQHLPDVVGHEGHRPEPGAYGRHGVQLTPGSLAHRALGDRVTVASYHHQGVASAGSATTSGCCTTDGTIEAVELADRRFALGVLWHPEVDADLKLFAALVRASTR